MNLLENLLIVAGIGLDIFAAFEIQGSLIPAVKRRPVIIACAIVVAGELLFYLGGYYAFRTLAMYGHFQDPVNDGEILAVIVMGLLGVRLLVKSIRKEFIQERRNDKLLVLNYIRIIVVSCLYTVAAGIASGLVGTTVWQLVIIIVIISVGMVIGGLYTGLHFGFEIKNKAYLAGTVLLWIAALEILFTKVI